MERDFKTKASKYFNEIMELQNKKQEAFKQFQKAIASKAYSKLKMSIFHQENEELENIIKSAEENRNNAQVFIEKKIYKFKFIRNFVIFCFKKRVEIISNKCNDIKRNTNSKLKEANSLLNNMDPNNAQFPHHDYYISLPNCLEEIRESIHDLSGRLDCMDDLDPEVQ